MVKPSYARLLRAVLRDTRGVSAIEYAVLAAFITVAIFASVAAVGSTVSDLFTTASNSL